MPSLDYNVYIEQSLSKPSTAKNMTKMLAREAKKNPELLKALLHYLSNGKNPFVWRACNVIKVISRSAKKYIDPHLEYVFKAIHIHKDNDSVAGILFKILVHCKANLSSHAEVIDIAIHQILKPSDIGYNGGYGMQLLELAYAQEPAFKEEFLLVVKQVYDTIEKAYVRNCADRLLKKLGV